MSILFPSFFPRTQAPLTEENLSPEELSQIENGGPLPVGKEVLAMLPRYPNTQRSKELLRYSLFASILAINSLAILMISQGLIFNCLWGQEDLLERAQMLCKASAVSFWQTGIAKTFLCFGAFLNAFCLSSSADQLFDPHKKKRLRAIKAFFQKIPKRDHPMILKRMELILKRLQLDLALSEEESRDVIKPFRQEKKGCI